MLTELYVYRFWNMTDRHIARQFKRGLEFDRHIAAIGRRELHFAFKFHARQLTHD